MKQKITNEVYSVGIVDKEVRIFHGYEVPYGTTYNSYLIIDDKITLVDFVKDKFSEEFLNNIKEIIGDKKIDYFVCNHIEPDHSGALPLLAREYPEAVIYGTAKGFAGLSAYYPETDLSNFITVKKGDTLSIGKDTLHFIPAPMVHWPDSMLTYLENEKVLFSNDALGAHISFDGVWDTELSEDFLMENIANYYANIVLPFGPSVNNLIKNLSEFPFEIACPSHGAVLKTYLPNVLEAYGKYAKNEVIEDKVVIVYDTMWGTTEKMACKIEKEWLNKGFKVEVYSLSDVHYSYVMGKIIDAKYIFVGSSTLNNEMLPSVAAFLVYMKGLKPKNRIGKAFGSYGWTGESIGKVEAILTDAGFEILEQEKVLWNV